MPSAGARRRVHRGGEQDKDAGQPVLPGGAEAEKARRAGDLLDKNDSGERAKEGAAAAEDTGAAEHHRRDALKRVVLSDRGIADADLAGEHDSTSGGE